MMRFDMMRVVLVCGLSSAQIACVPVENGSDRAAGASAPQSAAQLEGQASEQSARQCFFARQVSSYRDAPDGPDGEQQIYVDVGAADTYLFAVSRACPDIDFSNSVFFEQTGIGRICDALDVDLTIADRDFGRRSCSVRMLAKVADRAR